MIWEATVARAAPRTPMFAGPTSSRSTPTFTREATSTAYRGARLSPIPRRTAAYTL